MASSAFARHYLRNHGCFLFLWVLRCFTSPRSLQPPYIFRRRSPDITPVSFEVSLFGDPRIEARLPAPRGLSQVTTSFIGSWCLGIHRLPLVACCTTKMLASTVKFSTHGRNRHTHPTGQTHRPAEEPLPWLNPQDLTACSNQPHHHDDVPLPHPCNTRIRAVLTTRHQSRPTSQCSTIRRLPGHETNAHKTRRHGQTHPGPPYGSLERR